MEKRELGHSGVPSKARYVVLDGEAKLLSEHHTPKAASRGLIKALTVRPSDLCSIFKRIKSGWIEF